MYICEFCGRATTSSVVCECQRKPAPVGDGGPAFPSVAVFGAGGQLHSETTPGLSLRDWYATNAPAEYVARLIPRTAGETAALLVRLGRIRPYPPGRALDAYTYGEGDVTWLHVWARWQYADAMLAERAKRGK